MEDIKFDFYRNPSKSKDYQSSNYHIRINDRKVIDLKNLSETIQKNCSMTKSDVNGVLTALQEEIIYQLSFGNIVKLDNICQFETILGTKNKKCTGKETGKDIDLKAIRIHPENELKEEVRKELLNRKIARCKWCHSEEITTAEIDNAINEFFEKNEFITRKDIEKIFSITKYKARQIIKDLCDNKKITNVGSKLQPLYRKA